MPHIRDVGAWVMVGGKPLEEYHTKVVEGTTISCFVPSVPGQTFGVGVRNNHPKRVAFAVHVDGQWARMLAYEAGAAGYIDGVNVTSALYRPFTFGRIQIVDDAIAVPGVESAWSDLGCIEVRVCRIGDDRSDIEVKEVQDGTQGITKGPVHERSKVAGNHCVTLGNVRARPPIQYVMPTFIDSLEKPFARIKFFYRPRAELLPAQDIPLPPRIITSVTPPASNALKRRNENVDQLPPPSGKRSKTRSPARKPPEVKREDSASERRALAEKEERFKSAMSRISQLKEEIAVERSLIQVKREPSPTRSRYN